MTTEKELTTECVYKSPFASIHTEPRLNAHLLFLKYLHDAKYKDPDCLITREVALNLQPAEQADQTNKLTTAEPWS
jgi:hypothetical protein